jgi:transglutaminase-like putative cysteine protease
MTPAIQARAQERRAGADDQVDVARRCFEWVRDEIRHSLDAGDETLTLRASDVLREGTGFCFAKCHLLAALLRANGIRAGFAYQRIARKNERRAFSLHGLAVADLPGYGWYRMDPRGNTRVVRSEFAPPIERLAYRVRQAGELVFPGIYAEPVPSVVRTLERKQRVSTVAACLPDALTAYELEQ